MERRANELARGGFLLGSRHFCLRNDKKSLSDDPTPMISSGANPVTCDVTAGAIRCAAPASYVFKNAHTTRLMCFDCAQRYQAADLKPPPLEFALMELIPAREVLEMNLRMTDEKLTATRARMTAMAAVGTAERRLLMHLTLGVLALAVVVYGVLVWLSG